MHRHTYIPTYIHTNIHQLLEAEDMLTLIEEEESSLVHQSQLQDLDRSHSKEMYKMLAQLHEPAPDSEFPAFETFAEVK